MADREWMYTGFKDKTEEWVKGTGHFLEQAFGLAAKGAIRVWCPYSKCKNDKKKERRPMYHDIWKNGYVPNYTRWIRGSKVVGALGPLGTAPRARYYTCRFWTLYG